MHRLRVGLVAIGAHERQILRPLSSESCALKDQQVINSDVKRKPAQLFIDGTPLSIRYSTTTAMIDKPDLFQDTTKLTVFPTYKGREMTYTGDNENEYIYKYVHRRLHQRFEGIEKKILTMPIRKHIEDLKKLVHGEEKKRDVEKIGQVMADIRKDISSMNQLELTSLLTLLRGPKQVEEFRSIIGLIDIELRWLLKKHVKTRLMDLDLWFYVADLFYECRAVSKFNHVLVNYLINEPDIEMSNRQILHLLFLVVIRRDHDTLLTNYESRMRKLVPKATFEDLAIICMAYFKTKTQIHDTLLLRAIIDKTAEYLDTIDPLQPGYCSIIKAIRYSRSNKCRDSIMHMVLSLTEDRNKRIIFASPYNAVHTVKLMESSRIYDSGVLDMFKDALFQNLDEFRIKDIQYALTSLSNFAYMDLKLDKRLEAGFKRLARDIVSEKRRDVEHQYYHLIPLLRALAMFQFYDSELIEYTNITLADKNKIASMQGVLEFEKSALFVYVSTHIDDSPVKLRNHNTQVFNDLAQKISRPTSVQSAKQNSSLAYLGYLLHDFQNKNHATQSQLYRSIVTSLASSQELSPPEYNFYFQYTFPHQNYTDLMISKSKQAIGSFHPFSLLPRAVPAGERFCMIYAIQNADFIDGHARLCGYKRTMIRLAQKLGYNVMPVILQDPDIGPLAYRVKSTLDH